MHWSLTFVHLVAPKGAFGQHCLTQSPVVLTSSQLFVAPNIVTEGSTWRSSTVNRV